MLIHGHRKQENTRAATVMPGHLVVQKPMFIPSVPIAQWNRLLAAYSIVRQ